MCLDGCVHAKEWLSVSIVQYIASWLVAGLRKKEQRTKRRTIKISKEHPIERTKGRKQERKQDNGTEINERHEINKKGIARTQGRKEDNKKKQKQKQRKKESKKQERKKDRKIEKQQQGRVCFCFRWSLSLPLANTMAV
jgi:hypothetical protein